MRRAKFFLAALAAVSFLAADFISADDLPKGGFMVGRLAAKRLKKMREQENFSGADKNKDGKLDGQEIESAKKTHGNFMDSETFKKIDTNGDGMLSHDECEKFQKESEKAESVAKPEVKAETNLDKAAKN